MRLGRAKGVIRFENILYSSDQPRYVANANSLDGLMATLRRREWSHLMQLCNWWRSIVHRASNDPKDRYMRAFENRQCRDSRNHEICDRMKFKPRWWLIAGFC